MSIIGVRVLCSSLLLSHWDGAELASATFKMCTSAIPFSLSLCSMSSNIVDSSTGGSVVRPSIHAASNDCFRSCRTLNAIVGGRISLKALGCGTSTYVVL